MNISANKNEWHEQEPPFLSCVIEKLCQLQKIKNDDLIVKKFKLFSSNCVYKKLFFTLTGNNYSDEETALLLENIEMHRSKLKNTLGRDIGFFVAGLDYFENIQPKSYEHYTFIEEKHLTRLIERSSIDDLTRLYNKRTFKILLDKELKFALRKCKPLLLLMVDIDDFKEFNDQYGHLIGDSIISRVAEILLGNLRDMDIAGRFGGEEFIIALPDTSAHESQVVIERIRISIEQGFSYDKPLTVSIGVAPYKRTHTCLEDLIHDADVALYQAKSSGKNMVRYVEGC